MTNFTLLKRPKDSSGVAAFSVVRNEMYFLPHLLRHYRALGISDFWFLDDRSTDGTREYLLQQADCGVLQADRAFGEMVGDQRFGIVARTLVPQAFLRNRWVLTLDADEFLVLPSQHALIEDLAKALDAAGLRSARALMLDFFPLTLRDIPESDDGRGPFELCRHFDAFSVVDWPSGKHSPAALSRAEGVRPRMLKRLMQLKIPLGDLVTEYGFANMNKVPLNFWSEGTKMVTAHRSTEAPSDQVQLVLAHFKFFPGYRARIADALSTKAYWQQSIEYRFLDIAVRSFANTDLRGPRSRQFTSAGDLEAAGMLFSQLKAAV
ncbi:MAG TPA: glycosyltransferase family 2 protein [Ramlibacter sp.]|nr:glycosyltransferase family 2 protein [Ramlibacter sp.]